MAQVNKNKENEYQCQILKYEQNTDDQIYQDINFNDRFEIKYIQQREPNTKFEKMQRSSSIANFKIDFNPREAIVGSSSIDRLPIRKCNSTKSISKLSQKSQNQQRAVLQSQQYNIDMLKRVNQSLERENAYLKKQLDFFTQACSSKRASLNSIISVPGKKKEDGGFRDRLMSRLEGKVDKNDTESTGLFNSKFSSGRKMDQAEQSIQEIYSKYNLKSMLPKPEKLKQITTNFLQTIKQNYLKLKLIIDELHKKKQPVHKQTIDIINFLETIVIYSKNPKMGRSNIIGEKQKQKDKQIKNGMRIQGKQDRIENYVNQNMTSGELLKIFEYFVSVGIKNSKFISSLRGNLSFTRLVKKMAKNQ